MQFDLHPIDYVTNAVSFLLNNKLQSKVNGPFPACSDAITTKHPFLIIGAHTSVKNTASAIKQTFTSSLLLWKSTFQSHCSEMKWITTVYTVPALCAADPGVNPSHHLLWQREKQGEREQEDAAAEY